jgi:serine/threonine protein kinase
VTRRVFLQEKDYQNLIGPYNKLTDIHATKFAYHTVGRVTGAAAVMIPANHISNDDNETKKAVGGCLSKDVVVYELLGQGSFGTVHSAFCKVQDGLVAVKVLTLSNKLKKKDVERELLALRGLSNLYGNRLITAFRIERTAKDQHVVVMEKMQTSLKRVMETVLMCQDHDRCQRYMIMLCQALSAMHDNGWYHRDVKPANIMISADMQDLKLGDYGLTTKEKVAHGYAGSQDYLAPEMLDRTEVVGQNLEKADLW